MSIRAATFEDVPQLVAIGGAMHAESPRFRRLNFSADRLSSTLMRMIASPDGFVRVAYDQGGIYGGMVATVVPHWASHDFVAFDLALYVLPAQRGGLAAARLIHAYRTWAKEKGAVLINIGVSTGVRVEETTALLEGLGFRRAGTLLEA